MPAASRSPYAASPPLSAGVVSRSYGTFRLLLLTFPASAACAAVRSGSLRRCVAMAVQAGCGSICASRCSSWIWSGPTNASTSGAPESISSSRGMAFRAGGRWVLRTSEGSRDRSGSKLAAKVARSTLATHGLSTVAHSRWPASRSSTPSSAMSAAATDSAFSSGAPKQSEEKQVPVRPSEKPVVAGLS